MAPPGAGPGLKGCGRTPPNPNTVLPQTAQRILEDGFEVFAPPFGQTRSPSARMIRHDEPGARFWSMAGDGRDYRAVGLNIVQETQR